MRSTGPGLWLDTLWALVALAELLYGVAGAGLWLVLGVHLPYFGFALAAYPPTGLALLAAGVLSAEPSDAWAVDPTAVA
jgi:hypothetical protein